jgi:putative hydrolase of the HAD superfamily
MKAGKGPLLFFDIDDVLFPSTEFAILARHNALGAMIEMGLDFKMERLQKELDCAIAEKGSNYGNHFGLMMEKLKVKPELRPKYIAAAIGAYHNTKSGIQPYPDVPLALQSLRDKWGIYAASDGIAVKQWDKLIRLKIAHLFKGVMVSETLMVEKSPAFYRKIAKSLGALPTDCIMIGDREDKDIVPAIEAGWRAARVRRKGAKYSGGKTRAEWDVETLSELLAEFRKHLKPKSIYNVIGSK